MLPAHPRSVTLLRSRRASVLIAVVVALVMLQIVVIGLVGAGASRQDLSNRRLESAQALYGAEAAANAAMREIASGVDDDADGAIGSISAGVLTSGLVVGAARAAAAVTVSGNTYTVTASGNSGMATHAMRISANRTPANSGRAGLYTEYYNLGYGPGTCSNVNYSTPTAAGILPNVDLTYSAGGIQRWAGGVSHQFALRYTGTINIPAAGTWTFSLRSDDGSMMYINGVAVVNNDGDHSPSTASGTATLPAGPATFEVRFFENSGESVCTAFWQGPSVASTVVIPPSAFTCTPTQPVPGLVGATSITMTGSGTLGDLNVDAFNSTSGVYGGANVLTSGYSIAVSSVASQALTVQSAARVQGDALFGVGGAAGTVVYTPTSGQITGSKQAATVNAGVGSANLPVGMPGTFGPVSYSGSVTLNTNYHTDAMTFFGATSVITVSGNVVIQVDGDLIITDGVQVNLLANSSLTIYAYGNVSMQLTSQLNTNTGDPTKVVVHMLGGAKSFTVTNSAQFFGRVFNQQGGLSLVGSGTPPAQFYGNYLGNSVSISQKAKLHVDTTFGSSTGGSGTGSTSLLSWFQVQ